MCSCYCSCCSLGIMPCAQLPKKSAWILHQIGDKTSPVARGNDEVAGALNRRCYPYTRNGGHCWCLSSSLCLSEGFSIKDETMDVARSAPLRTHCHAHYHYLNWELRREHKFMVLRVRPTPAQFPTSILYTPVDNTPLHSIPSVGRL